MRKVLFLLATILILSLPVFAEQSVSLSGGLIDTEFEYQDAQEFGSVFFRTGSRFFFESRIIYADSYGFGLGAGVNINPESKVVFAGSIGVLHIEDLEQFWTAGAEIKIPFKQWELGLRTEYLGALDSGTEDLIKAGLFAGIKF